MSSRRPASLAACHQLDCRCSERCYSDPSQSHATPYRQSGSTPSPPSQTPLLQFGIALVLVSRKCSELRVMVSPVTLGTKKAVPRFKYAGKCELSTHDRVLHPDHLALGATSAPGLYVFDQATSNPCPLQCPNEYAQICHPHLAIAPSFSLPKLEHHPATSRIGVHHWATLLGQDHELHIRSIPLADTYLFFPPVAGYGVCESFFPRGFPHGSITAEWTSVVERTSNGPSCTRAGS